MSGKTTTFIFPNKAKMTFQSLANGTIGIPVVQSNMYKTNGLEFGNLGTYLLTESNVNLSLAQKELLSLHFCLGHFNLGWIQRLTRPRTDDSEPILPTRYKQGTDTLSGLRCAACQAGKQIRTSEGAVAHILREDKIGALKKEVLRSGSVV